MEAVQVTAAAAGAAVGGVVGGVVGGAVGGGAVVGGGAAVVGGVVGSGFAVAGGIVSIASVVDSAVVGAAVGVAEWFFVPGLLVTPTMMKRRTTATAVQNHHLLNSFVGDAFAGIR